MSHSQFRRVKTYTETCMDESLRQAYDYWQDQPGYNLYSMATAYNVCRMSSEKFEETSESWSIHENVNIQRNPHKSLSPTIASPAMLLDVCVLFTHFHLVTTRAENHWHFLRSRRKTSFWGACIFTLPRKSVQTELRYVQKFTALDDFQRASLDYILSPKHGSIPIL